MAVLYALWGIMTILDGLFLLGIVSAFVAVRPRWWSWAGMFLLLSITSGMIIWVGDNNLLMTLPVFVVVYLLCTKGELLGRLATAAIFFCLIMSVCALIDTYLGMLADPAIMGNLGRLISFGLLYLLLGRSHGQPLALSQRMWKLVLGMAALPFCALAAVVLMTYQKYDSPAVHALAMNQGLLMLPLVLLSSVVILRAAGMLAKYETLDQEKQLQSLREVYYQGIRREQTQLRTLRHDLRNHLTVVRSLLEQGEQRRAEEYLTQLLGSPALTGGGRLCQHEAANAVLAAKLGQMRQLGLDPAFQVQLPEQLPVADADLVALLGNALDNAMEAAEKSADKTVSLVCRADKGMLVVQVVNGLTGQEREDLATTKQDRHEHGLGLLQMRQIAQRYGGTLEAGPRDGRFELLACLELKEKEE